MKNRLLERWVVKAGSQMVCTGGHTLVQEWMSQVSLLRSEHGIEVIWVTSGAIASAVELTTHGQKGRTLSEKQALSAIGQPLVMDLYNCAIRAQGLTGAQVLLTADDMRDPKRRLNLQNSLEKLLEWKIVPILNENDAVATEEIQFGDNDSLSAQIAEMMSAQRLVLLTDVDGLYDKDPKSHGDAKLIPHLSEISATDLALVSTSMAGPKGTGGMYSKLLAAQLAIKAKIPTHLVRGDIPENLIQLASGKNLGTEIGPNLPGRP